MGKVAWLASYPKSGNTWFRIFLANLLHPEMAPVDINNIPLQSPLAAHASDRDLFDRITGVPSALLSAKELICLRRRVYEQIALSSASTLVMKTHDSWYCPPNSPPTFAGEHIHGVIYIARNPLDIASSLAAQSDGNIDRIIDLLVTPQQGWPDQVQGTLLQFPAIRSDWTNHVKGWLDQSDIPVLLLRYEDMLENSHDVFSKACNFLELDVTKDTVETAIKHSCFENLQSQELKHGFVEKSKNSQRFFRQGKAGMWRTELSENQVERICNSLHSTMAMLGYSVYSEATHPQS